MSHVQPAGPTASGPVACIDDLWVAAAHRRQGLGRRLVDAWRSAATAGGAEAFEVHTLAADDDARAFWARMGFGPWRVHLRADP